MKKCDICETTKSSRFHINPKDKKRECEECYIKNRDQHGYWLIPPKIYNPLNEEFKFSFDPCPNPRPPGFDGLSVNWERSNWVNPPFWGGITGWVRKAIEEQENGKTSVLILPMDNWVRLLVEAKAEIRSVGAHDWINTEDGSMRKAPRPSFLFILRGKV